MGESRGLRWMVTTVSLSWGISEEILYMVNTTNQRSSREIPHGQRRRPLPFKKIKLWQQNQNITWTY
jgi:hypothetical protein